MVARLLTLFPFFKAKPLPTVIITGIGMTSYQLAKQLQGQKLAQIVAFIDDEPWSNRTEMLGATVRYPSDMTALIQRLNVKVVIKMEGELVIANNIWQEVTSTPVRCVSITPETPLDQQVAKVKSALT